VKRAGPVACQEPRLASATAPRSATMPSSPPTRSSWTANTSRRLPGGRQPGPAGGL